MQRKLMQKLLLWQTSQRRQPLIVQGARQVGKTYLLKYFAQQHYHNFIYLNFETNEIFKQIFEKTIVPKEIIKQLELYFNQKIEPGKTLIIFDEIQAQERALTALKYFSEQANEYHLIAAGSLLGVVVNREKHSFPVGKVDFLTLYPLDFEEFLWAKDRVELAKTVKEHYYNNTVFPLHDLVLELYKSYLIVGGMPAVVKAYLEDESFVELKTIQDNILNSYIADMAKYASPEETTKIMAAFNSIPNQLAKENKKFQYKIVQKGGTSIIFGHALQWLKTAGLIHQCYKVEHGYMPLTAYRDLTSFKIYSLDPGLLTQQAGLDTYNLLHKGLNHNTFIGAVAENYVATALVSQGLPLYYWTSAETAEVDFVIQDQQEIVPIEVKANEHTKSRSLTIYQQKYQPQFSLRFSTKNFGWHNQIKSIPIYAVFCLEKDKINQTIPVVK